MADLKSLNTRLDPELKGMLNRLLTVLTEYESSIKPIVKESKQIKRDIKKTAKGLPTQEVKEAIKEILNRKGFDTTLDFSSGNFLNLERAISSLIATDPGLWPDLVEKALIEGPVEGGKIFARAQTDLVQEFLSVGHHEQGLKSLRPVLEALQELPGHVRERTLHILERPPYNFDFGELGLRHIFPFAHREVDLGPGRGPVGIRKDIRPLLDAAFPELGGVQNLDQINPNLRNLLKPLLAHSTAQRGTKGFVPPIDLIKGLTDPNKIAEALRPYLDAQKAGAENAMALSDAIFKHGFKKVNGELVLNKEAWLPDGALEKNIKEIPIIGLSPEATWTKPIKQVVKPSIEEVGKYTGNAPWAQTMLNFTPSGGGTVAATIQNSLADMNVWKEVLEGVDPSRNPFGAGFGFALDYGLDSEYRESINRIATGRAEQGDIPYAAVKTGVNTAAGAISEYALKKTGATKYLAPLVKPAVVAGAAVVATGSFTPLGEGTLDAHRDSKGRLPGDPDYNKDADANLLSTNVVEKPLGLSFN